MCSSFIYYCDASADGENRQVEGSELVYLDGRTNEESLSKCFLACTNCGIYSVCVYNKQLCNSLACSTIEAMLRRGFHRSSRQETVSVHVVGHILYIVHRHMHNMSRFSGP